MLDWLRRQAGHWHDRGWLPGPLLALGRSMFGTPLRRRTDRLQADQAALAQAVGDMQRQLADLRRRNHALELLLTGTAANRPAGAAGLVARLASPVVSVIMPTHNRAAFVGEAIASVQAQTFRDWELLVVDDGSTDDTAAAVAPFLADKRIRYLHQPNAGGANARNRGIAAAQGGLIAYLDDDNLFFPDFLARAVDCFVTEPDTDVAYGALVTSLHNIEDGCILWRPFDRAALLAGNYIDTSVIIHRRALIERYGQWDDRVERVADWDIVLRFTADKPARALGVLAAAYREVDTHRITRLLANDDSDRLVQSRWRDTT